MQNTGVLVASAHAPIRQLLADIVRAEPGFAIVGEAGNEIEARALARQLKPEAVLVDFHLPHSMGLDSVRLSRMSGLDTAMSIMDELKDTRVILLTNLDTAIFRGKSLVRGIARRLLTEIGGIKKALTLRELCFEGPQAAAPVFVHVEVRERESVATRRTALRLLRGAAITLAGAFVLSNVVGLVVFFIGAIVIAIT